MGSKGSGEITSNGEEKMNYRRLHKIIMQVTQAAFLISIIGGCGYTTRSMISDKFKTIYVVPFVNRVDITRETDVASKYRIYRPMLETDITKSVINKFLSDGNLRSVKEESADLILKGELIDYRKDALRYDEGEEVSEYRINLVVNISLFDRKENKIVWEESNFTGDTTYFAISTNPQYKSEDTALNGALTDLARRIVERTVEQW